MDLQELKNICNKGSLISLIVAVYEPDEDTKTFQKILDTK